MSMANTLFVAWPLHPPSPYKVTSSLECCSNILSAQCSTPASSTSISCYPIIFDVFAHSSRLLGAVSLGLRSTRRGCREGQLLNIRKRGKSGSSWCAIDNSNEDSTWNEIDDGDERVPSHQKQIQAAVAKLGDPLRNLMSSASKKLLDYFDNYQNSKIEQKHSFDQKSEQEYWQEIFAEIDQQEKLASVLRFQLDEAVEKEDFQEAARLKLAVSAIKDENTVTEAFNDLKKALDEERYSDAAKLRDEAGTGLVGWWSGISEGENDPFGQIINITPAQGRLLAKSYTARQLITEASGVPLFEVFVTKDEHSVYRQQAVCLRRYSNHGSEGPVRIDVVSRQNTGNLSEEVTEEVLEVLGDGKKPNKDEDSVSEQLSRLVSFLKDKIPDVKVKVFQVTATESAEADLPKIVKQLEQDEDCKEFERAVSEKQEISEISEIQVENESEIPDIHTKDNTYSLSEEDLPFRLVVSVASQSDTFDKPPRLPVRILSKIEHKTKDMFVIHVEDPRNGEAAAFNPPQALEVNTTSTKMPTVSDTRDIVKILTTSEKVPVKLLTDIGEIIKLAVSHAQRKRGLSRTTSYSRIDVAEVTYPLSGLYVGAFGPYTSEVVQLRRKYGNWHEEEVSTAAIGKLDFFEYVEAVKLTGDLSVPAGKVTFRAKVGKENRLSHRLVYPEELGVIARYKGQGRMAEPGFRNPQWVDGELVLLKKKSGGLSNGAELGFVYSVDERHILVLFSRLSLSSPTIQL